MKSNELKIVCFMCNFFFCRNEAIPPSVNVARVKCIGRIDPALILEIFKKGADGVMLAGCKPPDCHYVEGNLQAEQTIKLLKKLLALTDLEPKRVKLLLVSPLEEQSFNYYAEEFLEEIKKFGSSPLDSMKPDPKLMVNILAAERAASDFRLRVLLGREKELIENGDVYGEKTSQNKFDELLDEVAQAEYTRNKIYNLLEKESSSVRDISKHFGLEPQEVLRHIVVMRRKGMLRVDKVVGTTPIYASLEVR